MLYVYLTSWYMDGNSVENPVLDHDISPANVRFEIFYPDADMDGKPDGSSIMLIVEAPLDYYSSVPDIDLLPSYSLGTLISDIPTEVISDVVSTLVHRGVPADMWSGTTTAGHLLDKVLAYFSPQSKSITERYTGREAEFG